MLDPRRTTIVLGAAGCGKTTQLLGYVEEALASGTKPWEVGFFSFTTKAANEGKERASKRFGIPTGDLRYFRTLHSLAFSHMGLRREGVFGKQHLREFGDLMGVEFNGRGSMDGDSYGMATGDRMLFMCGLARNTQVPLQSIWEDSFEDDIGWPDLDRFNRGLGKFKESRGLLDFDDMMEGLASSPASSMPKLKLLVVDEIQDVSSLQWRAVCLLAHGTERTIVGGDDWQSIYTFSGADVAAFIDLQGDVVNLEQSYRIPATVHALSESIGARIQKKRPREFRPRPEQGEVLWLNSVEDSDLSHGTWLLLARNGYMLRELEDWCSVQGFSYHSVSRDPLKSPALAAIKVWEGLRRGGDELLSDVSKVARYLNPSLCRPGVVDAMKERQRTATMAELRTSGAVLTDAIWHEALTRIAPSERDYFIAARRRGEALLKEPRIRISTIHAAKGGEADHVLLMTDVSYRCHQNAEKDPDSENRVFYVGATRCRKTLSIVSPQTNLSYEI